MSFALSRRFGSILEQFRFFLWLAPLPRLCWGTLFGAQGLLYGLGVGMSRHFDYDSELIVIPGKIRIRLGSRYGNVPLFENKYTLLSEAHWLDTT